MLLLLLKLRVELNVADTYDQLQSHDTDSLRGNLGEFGGKTKVRYTSLLWCGHINIHLLALTFVFRYKKAEGWGHGAAGGGDGASVQGSPRLQWPGHYVEECIPSSPLVRAAGTAVQETLALQSASDSRAPPLCLRDRDLDVLTDVHVDSDHSLVLNMGKLRNHVPRWAGAKWKADEGQESHSSVSFFGAPLRFSCWAWTRPLASICM